MKQEEYQVLAMRTSPEDHDRITNGCLGLIGESGEVADAIKKWKFQSGKDADFPKEKIIDEIGDVLWYCAELCEGAGVDLSSIIQNYALNYPYPVKLRSVIRAAMFLSLSCLQCCHELDKNGIMDPEVYLNRDEKKRKQIAAKIVKERIGNVSKYVRHILNAYCGASIEDAMEYNIEKLIRRYPDGFDPEKSLHRFE